MKKTEEVRDALKKNQKLQAVKEQELAEGRQELAELERTWRTYEKQVLQEGTSRGRDIELDKNQVSLCQTVTFHCCISLL